MLTFNFESTKTLNLKKMANYVANRKPKPIYTAKNGAKMSGS